MKYIPRQRNDLDRILSQKPVQASGREHLRELLNRASGGVVFTTIQKFLPPPERGSVTRGTDETSNAAEHSDANDIAECSGSQSPAPSGKMPELSARQNSVVIADEAHRSQYGFGGRVNEKTGEMSYGFASNLRDALPNASFIGFTGTPIEKTDPNTRAVFGDLASQARHQSVAPYYESRWRVSWAFPSAASNAPLPTRPRCRSITRAAPLPADLREEG